MPTDWMSSVLSGLAGGVLASGLSVAYAHYVERKRDRQARTANSFALISALEAFVINCAEYIESAGEALSNAYRTSDTRALGKLTPPGFAIPPDVDFKTIDTGIASNVLILPFLIKRSNDIARTTFMNISLVEATEDSVQQFGIRGLAAWKLAVCLRNKAKLPKPQYDDDWRFLEILRHASKGNEVQAPPPPPPPNQ